MSDRQTNGSRMNETVSAPDRPPHSRLERSSLVVVGVFISVGFLFVNYSIGLEKDMSSFIAVGVVMVFSLFAQALINFHRDMQARLEEYSSTLEKWANERTGEMIRINAKLTGEIQLRRETEDLLRASETRYRTIFENTGTAILISDRATRAVLVNSQLLKMIGYSFEELQAMGSWAEIMETGLEARVQGWIEEDSALSGLPRSLETVLVRKNGETRNVYITLATFQDRDDILVSLVDITELKKAERLLYHQAFHDHLTDLPNRVLFMEVLNIALRRARRSRDHLFSVLYLDIDRFKSVNDSMGHPFGDRLLVKLAETIKKCLRDSDTVARMGGDEFAVILDDVQGPEYTNSVVERIFSMLKQPLEIDGHEIYTGVSMGIVPDCRNYENPDDIVRDADAAMYGAKEAGRCCFKVFEKKIHSRFKRVLEMETAMRKAIKNEEFILHYQPIVSMNGGRVISFEALIRWEQPGMGLVFPAEFILVAEEIGIILPLGQWVLAKACEQMSTWQKAYPALSDCSVSVNLSVRQFKDPDLEEHVMCALETSGLSAHNLRLEITENDVLDNAERTIELLGRLRKLGIKIMVDDFGIGYSSLSYLHRLPIDVLKIDRSFVDRVDTSDSPGDRKIVETIIVLAHSLGLDVVAEGVERDAQVNFLSRLNCQFAQGNLYYRPMPPEMIQDEYLERITG